MAKRILIIDDSRTARMFIKQCFEIAGFSDCEFLEASQGEEALTMMNTEGNVALVITDINMPVKDGLTMIREMRSSETLKKIPVLVITSTQNAAREQELKPLGVEAILAKPLHLPLVAEKLTALKTQLGM
ncbi:MAG TPA: response regulator [Oligoflexus sp.]|uniref:response regulator n=1 Tax=Oligoflexus sp. TaxID=1971216 RepID=UPI002D7F6AF4|nr:response regulator [Oligoflexus sp.]HET9238613.1 response regulator [Oligoflexus sp.]